MHLARAVGYYALMLVLCASDIAILLLFGASKGAITGAFAATLVSTFAIGGMVSAVCRERGCGKTSINEVVVLLLYALFKIVAYVGALHSDDDGAVLASFLLAATLPLIEIFWESPLELSVSRGPFLIRWPIVLAACTFTACIDQFYFLLCYTGEATYTPLRAGLFIASGVLMTLPWLRATSDPRHFGQQAPAAFLGIVRMSAGAMYGAYYGDDSGLLVWSVTGWGVLVPMFTAVFACAWTERVREKYQGVQVQIEIMS